LQKVANTNLVDSGLGQIKAHKIGCTSKVMQNFLNINSPCAGDIFEKTIFYNSVEIPYKGFTKVGVECELAVEIAKDFHPGSNSIFYGDLEKFVGGFLPAIEIVDDRYLDYLELGVPTLIADNFFNSGAVIGDVIYDWKRLNFDRIIGKTLINNIIVGKGRASFIMDSPLNAFKWYLDMCNKNKKKIKKGDIILLGSIVETKWLNTNDLVTIEIEEFNALNIYVN
jgi:2-keto-4-pentenoate hydratase